MQRYVARRLLLMVPTLLGVAVITFVLLRMVPGDVVQLKLAGEGGNVAPEVLEQERARLGLDRPLAQQFVEWVWGAVRLDFGLSMWTGRPIVQEILIRLELSVQLMIMATIIASVLAIPLGVLAAVKHDTWVDYAVRVFSIAGLAIPSFWLGIVLILLLSAWAPGFASLGYVPFSDDPLGNLQRMMLPAFALALPILANLSRLVRSAMLDALGQDYIRTARAKGLAERKVVYKHALRNALIPFLTSVGIMTGYLLGGAIVVEQVFAIPGLGRLILGAIAERNYPLIQATILVVTAGFVVVNFLVDFLYIIVDPRVRA